VALDLLDALEPPPPIGGVCARLGRFLGRDHDDRLFEIALRFPPGIEDSTIGQAVEAAVGNGLVHEVPGAARLPAAFNRRLVAAALIAAERGHADAAASVLHDLPTAADEVFAPAAALLRAPDVAARATAAALWSKLIGELGGSVPRCAVAFGHFAPAFFAAAAWHDAEDVAPLRELLWGLACEWRLASASRPSLLPLALRELEEALQGAGDWRRAEAALWALSRYAKTMTEDMKVVVDACLMVLQQLLTVPGLAPLATSACAVLEAVPCARALGLLLDTRLVDVRHRGEDVCLAVAGAVRACCAAARDELWAQGTAAQLAEELQARALVGEDWLVGAAAELLAGTDVQPLAKQWACLCAQAPPDKVAMRAQALFSTIVRADVCLALWRDCASMLHLVSPAERVRFVLRVADFARDGSVQELAGPAVELWVATWPSAEGDEDLIAALEQLVRASARTSAVAAPAVELLIRDFGAAGDSWAPHTVASALGVIEASVASAGSPWPLTVALAGFYGAALHPAAALAARQPVAALSLVGALASWARDGSDLGRGLRQSLLAQEAAVRVIVERAEDQRLARRIAAALGLSAPGSALGVCTAC